MRTFLIAATLAVAAPSAWAGTLPALTQLDHGPARVSALVVNLDTRQVLAELTPNQRLTPASVSKLYTAAAALQRWGATHRFRTRLLTDGRVRDGRLEGNLILLGAGDPDLDHARLWRLVTQLQQRGIERITGDLVVNASLFGNVPCVAKDRCDARTRTRHSYDAPLSSAGINFSTLELTVLPALEAGAPARLSTMPPGLEDVTIDGGVTTVAADQTPSVWAWRGTPQGANVLQITGRVPVGDEAVRIRRSVADPAAYTGSVASTLLRTAGILVDGGTQVRLTPPDAGLRTVAEVDSPPLLNQLRDMLAYSNNYMADTLTLHLLAGQQGSSGENVTLERASQYLEDLGHRANAEVSGWLGEADGRAEALAIDSGSGLSVSNRLSARDVVGLLAYMQAQHAAAAAFAGILPVPQFAESGRMRNGNTTWATRVAAKTGTLTEPVSVFGYAGYLKLADGSRGAFAVLVNGRDPTNPVPSRAAIAAIQNDIEPLLMSAPGPSEARAAQTESMGRQARRPQPDSRAPRDK